LTGMFLNLLLCLSRHPIWCTQSGDCQSADIRHSPAGDWLCTSGEVLIDGIFIDFASMAEAGRGELLHWSGMYITSAC
jgi:hypothetical protein